MTGEGALAISYFRCGDQLLHAGRWIWKSWPTSDAAEELHCSKTWALTVTFSLKSSDEVTRGARPASWRHKSIAFLPHQRRGGPKEGRPPTGSLAWEQGGQVGSTLGASC